MSESLAEAIEIFRSAIVAVDPNCAAMNEEQLAEVESYLGRSLPEQWRGVLCTVGWGSRKTRPAWPDSTGQLTLNPMDATEHQVETDDGIAITASGRTVIGYVEGIGDCVVLGEGRVFHHSHGGTDEDLGTLAQFLIEFSKHIPGT